MLRNIQKTRAKAKNSRSNQQKKKNFEKIRQRNRKIASIVAWIVALAVFVLTITYAQVKLLERAKRAEDLAQIGNYLLKKMYYTDSRLEDRWYGHYLLEKVNF